MATQIFFRNFHPENWGRLDSQFDLRIFFSDGLVQPPINGVITIGSDGNSIFFGIFTPKIGED